MKGAALRGVLALLLTVGRAEAQQAVRVSVRDVRGPRSAATLRARWTPRRFADFQDTFLGGALRLDVEISSDGAIGVTRVRSTGESTARCAICVRRALVRARFAPRPGETSATLHIIFPPLGLAVPSAVPSSSHHDGSSVSRHRAPRRYCSCAGFPLDASLLALTSVSNAVGRARKVRFDPESLLRAMDLTERFGDGAALPGGAVQLLRAAAHQATETPVVGKDVLGPTGVGKTESALALTEYLFGDPKRLHREGWETVSAVLRAQAARGPTAVPADANARNAIQRATRRARRRS